MEKAVGDSPELEVQHLRQETLRLSLQLQRLSEVIEAVQKGPKDPLTLLQGILDGACRVVDAPYGILTVPETPWDSSVALTYGFSAVGQEAPEFPQLWRNERPAAGSSQRDHPHPFFIRESAISVDNAPPGSLRVLQRAGARENSEEDQRLLSLFAAQASIVLRSVDTQRHLQKDLNKAQEMGRELEALNAITQLAVSSLDLNEVLTSSLPFILFATDTDAAEVWLLDPVTGVLELAAHYGESIPGFFDRSWFNLGEGVPGIAARSHAPVIARDLAHAPDTLFLRRQAMAGDCACLCALPMMVQGKPVGALCVVSTYRNCFGEQETALLARIATALAIAIRNARLYSQEQTALAATREAEGALAEANDRLQALVDHSPVGILVADMDGQVVLVNAEAERLTGLSHQIGEILERYERALVYRRPDGRTYDPAELPLQRALQTGETVIGEEIHFHLADGRVVYTLVNATPLVGADGERNGALAVIQDISKTKDAERLKEEFFSLVTHDLKTPLATIKAVASSALLSADQAEPMEMDNCARIIDAEADRLNELITNILDMSRFQAGAMPLDIEECYLLDVVGDSINELRRHPDHGSRTVLVEVPPDLPPLMADYNHIRRVLVNLLSNAAKYSEEHTVIRVCARLNPPEATMKVEVTDQGMGLAEEELGVVFERFYRGHHQPSGQRAGSGLGLAVCKAIVEAHGGQIGVTSRLGRGSTFYINLPLDRQVRH